MSGMRKKIFCFNIWVHGSIGECPFKHELFGSHVPCYHSNGEFNANKVGNLIIDNHVKINYRIKLSFS